MELLGDTRHCGPTHHFSQNLFGIAATSLEDEGSSGTSASDSVSCSTCVTMQAAVPAHLSWLQNTVIARVHVAGTTRSSGRMHTSYSLVQFSRFAESDRKV